MIGTNTQDEKQELIALVVAAQAGDRDAFGHIVEKFQNVVFSVALKRLRNYAEAQELTQDVFIQAMQKIEQLREPAAFAGWIRSITVRMAINRAVRRAPDISVEPETLAANCIDQDTPLVALLQNERKENLHEGLDRLRAMDRETLQAFYVQGQSLREMSDEFDAPIGTIKRRLHVARKRLAKELEELVAC